MNRRTLFQTLLGGGLAAKAAPAVNFATPAKLTLVHWTEEGGGTFYFERVAVAEEDEQK